MQLETFIKILADNTRLRIVLLLMSRSELCVCELTETLQLAQPKISRHLALMRESGLVLDRKAGLWVYYRLHPQLPEWAKQALIPMQYISHQEALFQEDQIRLAQCNPMGREFCG
ncbi:MAG: metalloregulator ArsR/SmtB family transcription factor [Thiofilum sp.]|uniref:metalloregulator ArsR/SmtB family transcription factor n=1 Tax=Thiofilum sp. TaxID=2212733 RepID=UPI0025EBBD23|nr:metalloregulator ArsR/SmtB family transcription factor [Thiofilum sp.]MBK8455384.1 metalloregulator ArsR/SmtB family transcription factor [Thiofilum sp.]